MKSSGFILAFVISAALHAGVLSSNLLHVRAESTWLQKKRSVQLHIVPAMREPAFAHEKNAGHTIPKTDVPVPEKPVETSPDSEISIAKAVPEPKLPLATVQRPAKIEPPERVLSPMTAENVAIPAESTIVETQPVSEETPEPDVSGEPDFSGNTMQDTIHHGKQDTLAALHARGENGADRTGRAVFPAESEAQIPGLADLLTYPRYCRLHNQEGTTELSVEILADGTLGKVELVHSSGYNRLDSAAVKAILNSDPVPATKDGRTVTSITRIDVKFNLEDWGK